MKFKKHTILIVLAVISFSCSGPITHKVVEYFDEGDVKTISIFEGESQIQKIEFANDGNILSRSFYQNDCLFAKWISADFFDSSNIISNYYGDGTLKSQGYIVDNNMHGHWSHYYRNGELESDRYYFHGQPIGDWYSYHHGDIVVEHYGYDKLNGSWIEYYNADLNISGENKLIKKEVSFFNKNQLTGIYQFYYKDGILKTSGYYIDGKKDGKWNHYNQKGSLVKTENYKQGKLDGAFKLFFSDGETEKLIGTYKDNKRSETWFWFFDKDKKSNHKINYSK